MDLDTERMLGHSRCLTTLFIASRKAMQLSNSVLEDSWRSQVSDQAIQSRSSR